MNSLSKVNLLKSASYPHETYDNKVWIVAKPQYNDETLDSLLVQTAGKDRKAFRMIYEATSSRIYSDLLRLMGNPSDANDLLQEVYVRIWRQADRYDSAQGRALAWIARVARNAGIDALRRRKPEVNGDVHFETKVCEQPNPFEKAQQDKVSNSLRRSVDRLPASQRNAVTLFYFEECSLAEISERLNAPVNTTKSWIRRGLISLREEFGSRNLTEFLVNK